MYPSGECTGHWWAHYKCTLLPLRGRKGTQREQAAVVILSLQLVSTASHFKHFFCLEIKDLANLIAKMPLTLIKTSRHEVTFTYKITPLPRRLFYFSGYQATLTGLSVCYGMVWCRKAKETFLILLHCENSWKFYIVVYLRADGLSICGVMRQPFSFYFYFHK